jgi:hypothetical protein
MNQKLFEEFAIEKWKVQTTMIELGGSFVNKLGIALVCADPENAAKIKFCFPEFWHKYLQLANQTGINEKSETFPSNLIFLESVFSINGFTNRLQQVLEPRLKDHPDAQEKFNTVRSALAVLSFELGKLEGERLTNEN